MTEIATLARPYAEAVFKTAQETATASKWSEMLAFIATVVQDPEVAAAADNPRVEREKLTGLLLDICSEQLNEQGSNFLKLLIENGRLVLVPEIAVLFEKYKAEQEGYVDVEVFSAYAMNKQDQQTLIESLQSRFNKQVHINVTIDKSLIGGVLVRAGDQVIDASIKGRLQQLAKQL